MEVENISDDIGKVLRDPCLFFEFLMGKKPYPYQRLFLKCNGRFRAVCWCRQSGKSTAVAIEIIWKCLMKKNTYIRLYTPKQKLAERIYDNIIELIDNNDFVKSHVIHRTRTKIIFDTPSRIEHSTTGLKGDTGRGYSPTDVYYDEASRIPDEAFQAIEPSIMVTKGSITMISTPYGINKFYEVRHTKGSGYIILPKVTVYDCPAYTKKEIEQLKKTNPEAYFRMEYLAEDIDETNNWFSRKLILKCIHNDDEENGPVGDDRYIMSVDFARMGDDETAYCIAKITEGKIKVVNWLTTKKTSMPEIERRIKYLHGVWHFESIYLDTTPLGVGVFDTLLEESYPVFEAKMQMKEKGEMYKQIKLMMEQGNVSFPTNEKAMDQMSMLTFNFNAFGLTLTAPPKGHDDYPDALSMLAKHFLLGQMESGGKEEKTFIKFS